MKTKMMACLVACAAVWMTSLSAQAGLHGTLGWGSPGWHAARPCARALYAGCRAWAACPTPFPYFSYVSYAWYPAVWSGWSISGFSNVSPMMDYAPETPVYKVPPPVLPAQPIAVYPDMSFRWKR